MHMQSLRRWQHDHSFGQERRKSGERRTLFVLALTGAMMGMEIAAGILFGSMALLADGLHMASHSAALGINLFAYLYARRHAGEPRFSFGTGKVNTLGGFTGAILLALFALLMAWESVRRFSHPVAIRFDSAILVAVLGLLVNGLSALVLGEHRRRPRSDHPHEHGGHSHDHNLRSAYMHVLADAVTSVAAILALLAGKHFGAIWMDPLMAIAGSVLVARWAWGLLRDTSGVLLDRQAPAELQERVRQRLEAGTADRLAELHLWCIGPGIYSASAVLVSGDPRSPEHYRSLLAEEPEVVHVTVEVHRCDAPTAEERGSR